MVRSPKVCSGRLAHTNLKGFHIILILGVSYSLLFVGRLGRIVFSLTLIIDRAGEGAGSPSSSRLFYLRSARAYSCVIWLRRKLMRSQSDILPRRQDRCCSHQGAPTARLYHVVHVYG